MTGSDVLCAESAADSLTHSGLDTNKPMQIETCEEERMVMSDGAGHEGHVMDLECWWQM